MHFVLYHLDFPDKFIKATADFRYKKVSIDGMASKNIPGYYLPSTGNFIFSYFNSQRRKMVLVSNTGKRITCGYLKLPAETWKDVDSWSLEGIKNDQYFVENFNGE